MVYYVILVLVIVAMGFWVWKLYQDKKESNRDANALAKERDEYMEMGKGLVEYNQKMQEKKNQIKSKIMELVKSNGKINNSKVAKNLSVARTSAFRYLDELEKEGKLKQVGKTGTNVTYTSV